MAKKQRDAPEARSDATPFAQYSNLTSIKEGLASILVPKQNVTSDVSNQPKTGVEVKQSVFYNPVQQFNRDLTVLAIRAYADDLAAVRKQKHEKSVRRQNSKDFRGTKRKADALDHASEDHEPQIPAVIDVEAVDKSVESSGINGAGHGPDHDVAAMPHGTNDASQHLEAEEKITYESGAVDTHDPAAVGTKSSHDNDIANATRVSTLSLKILDALSATGLRAIRYAKELPFHTTVVANDMSPQASEEIQANIKHNGLEGSVTAVISNALAHMYKFAGGSCQENVGKYDVIDLDPYGTAIPFADAAMFAVKNGGLLCVTFTDAGVWASCGYPEKTYSLYGGTPLRGLHSHEGGLRLILHAMATAAARQGMAIEPLLSLSIDFYARVFVRVRKSPADVKLLAGKTMLVYSCDSGCGAWKTQFLGRNQAITAKDGGKLYKHTLAQGPSAEPHCEHCGCKTHISGPMYGGPLHNPAFIETILEYLPGLDPETYVTKDRIEGMLSTALEETSIEDASIDNSSSEDSKSLRAGRPVPPMDPAMIDKHPFFFVPSVVAKVLHCRSPPEAPVKGALRHAGYKFARSHTKPTTIKTNAPWSFIWEMMREWVRTEAPVKEGAIKPGSAGEGIMNRKSPRKDESNGETERGGRDDKHGRERPEQSNDSKGGGDSRAAKIVFDEKLGRDIQRKRLVRYQVNPRENWGPMNRAKGTAATSVD